MNSQPGAGECGLSQAEGGRDYVSSWICCKFLGEPSPWLVGLPDIQWSLPFEFFEATFRLEQEFAMILKQEFCVTNDETPPEFDDEHKASGASPKRVDPDRSLVLALAAARTAAENGGSEIVVLDMSKHTAITDYFVIATGTSRRQLHAISEEIDHKLEDELNDKRMNIDGYDDSKWIVLDYGTVVIHLFDEDTRKFYALETLWGDAAKVDLTETLKNIR